MTLNTFATRPQKFFKNLHIVQQLVRFSFLAKSFYQAYHGMIRTWPGDIAIYARTDWTFASVHDVTMPWK
jgi:hypothetical protein